MNIQLYYLVMASSGVYDCFSQWVVACFAKLDDANAYRLLAANASKESIEAYKASPEGRDRKYMYFDEPTKYDLGHSVRDTEVTYRVTPVPFVEGAVGHPGLLSIAEAFGSARAVTDELNYPGLAQKQRRPVPLLPAEVKSDFGDKLKAALAA